MHQDIRYAIFGLDIFQPMSNRGIGIEGMILSSKFLEDVSPEEIEKEIQLMKAEGLIDLYDPNDPKCAAWRSTEKGQIEIQKLNTKLGHRSFAMANQGKYSSEDLILGLFAVEKVSSMGFHHYPHDRKVVEIYLFDKDANEIAVAFESLISSGYLSTVWENVGVGDGPTLTAKGLQYYRKEVHKRLGLDDGQCILDPRQVEQFDTRFEKLGFDPKLVKNLQKRWNEALQTRDANAFLSSVTMLGSVLEGLLLASFQKDLSKPMTAQAAPRDRRSGSTKPIGDWSLQEMINVAVEIGLVGKAVSKHSQELRDSRNLIHPNKQVSEDFEVDASLVRISFEVVNAVLNSLLKD